MQLKGHSGCKLVLKNNIVSKISKDIEYNKRLIKQCKKQQISPFAPEIYITGHRNKLYFFDMQYIRGVSLASFLNQCKVHELEKISEFLINFILQNKATENPSESSIHYKAKIQKTYHIIEQNDIIDKVFNFLMDLDWSKINKSRCHGDLTLENILYSYTDNKIYLIDFLDVFYETWLTDVSKLMQDLVIGWSFRNTNISENLRLRVLLLNKKIYEKLKLNKREWKLVYSILLLDMMRILPYTKDKKIFNFVINSIKKLLEIQKEFFDEYFYTTMCWPIHEIS